MLFLQQTNRSTQSKYIVTTSMKPHFLGKMHQRVNNTNTMISTYTSINRSSSHFCLYILTSFFVIVTICVGFLWNIYTHWSQKCQCASGEELYKMYIFKWVSFYSLHTFEQTNKWTDFSSSWAQCVGKNMCGFGCWFIDSWIQPPSATFNCELNTHANNTISL